MLRVLLSLSNFVVLQNSFLFAFQEKTRHDIAGVKAGTKSSTDTGVSITPNAFIDDLRLIGDPHRLTPQDPFHSINTATGLIPTEIGLLVGLLNPQVITSR